MATVSPSKVTVELDPALITRYTPVTILDNGTIQ